MTKNARSQSKHNFIYNQQSDTCFGSIYQQS